MTYSQNDIMPTSLLDREKIRELKFNYCDSLDHADVDAILKLFTPDALYNLGKFGSYRGHDEIRECLTGLLATFTLTSHTPTIGRIRINGDKATAVWKALVAMEAPLSDTVPNATTTMVFLDYHDTMVRENGEWKFKEVILDFRGEWIVGPA